MKLHRTELLPYRIHIWEEGVEGKGDVRGEMGDS
jgi:hypothetical protein